MRWVLLLSLAYAPSMADEIVAAHNAVRAGLKLPPLVWSDKLAKGAQEWADTLIKDGSFRHPAKSPWGQNLAEFYRDQVLPEQTVQFWAAEALNYDYKTNRCTGTCGHYTQLVWRDTKEVGCAVARRGDREVWVCNYLPPGNYVGQRPY